MFVFLLADIKFKLTSHSSEPAVQQTTDDRAVLLTSDIIHGRKITLLFCFWAPQDWLSVLVTDRRHRPVIRVQASCECMCQLSPRAGVHVRLSDVSAVKCLLWSLPHLSLLIYELQLQRSWIISVAEMPERAVLQTKWLFLTNCLIQRSLWFTQHTTVFYQFHHWSTYNKNYRTVSARNHSRNFLLVSVSKQRKEKPAGASLWRTFGKLRVFLDGFRQTLWIFSEGWGSYQ